MAEDPQPIHIEEKDANFKSSGRGTIGSTRRHSSSSIIRLAEPEPSPDTRRRSWHTCARSLKFQICLVSFQAGQPCDRREGRQLQIEWKGDYRIDAAAFI